MEGGRVWEGGLVNNGTSEAWTERGKEMREEASGGRSEWEGREQSTEGDEQGRSER